MARCVRSRQFVGTHAASLIGASAPFAIQLIHSIMSLAIPSASSITLVLAQPWNSAPDPGFMPTSVEVTWQPEALLIQAALTDTEIVATATADHQKFWMLGDVFEIFLQVEGREDYLELHVDPNNHRLHLHKPNIEGQPAPAAEPLSFEEMLISPVGFSSEVGRAHDGWTVNARIPAPILGLDAYVAGLKLRVSFCRYDAATHRPPILSTTAAHPIISFHRPQDWAVCTLKGE